MPALANRLHPASLIYPSRHNPYLLQLTHRHVSIDMIKYIARQVELVIAVEGESTATSAGPGLQTPPRTPHKASVQDQHQRSRLSPSMVPLDHFICHLVRSANVQVSTLLTTLIYLERLRAKLPAMSTGQYLDLSAIQPITKSISQACLVHDTVCFLQLSSSHRNISMIPLPRTSIGKITLSSLTLER